jgi:hypothetical protein
VTKPKPEATITKVRVDLQDGAGAVLQQLFEEAPGENGENVKLENNGQSIKVRVTMKTVSSSVAATPPPTHTIRYRFTVQADVDGQSQWSDPKDSEQMLALWRMPGEFARYGQPPDKGLDDWASRGTYDWLFRNAGLFGDTSINDVSGEHARNIGHSQHERGVEMDIFHFKRFAGVECGEQLHNPAGPCHLCLEWRRAGEGAGQGVGHGDAQRVRRVPPPARSGEAVHYCRQQT